MESDEGVDGGGGDHRRSARGVAAEEAGLRDAINVREARMPRRVAFRFCHPFAGSVTLAGDFNEWSTMANPMTYDPTCRCWSTTVELGPGRYEYKFFVDGT